MDATKIGLGLHFIRCGEALLVLLVLVNGTPAAVVSDFRDVRIGSGVQITRDGEDVLFANSANYIDTDPTGPIDGGWDFNAAWVLSTSSATQYGISDLTITGPLDTTQVAFDGTGVTSTTSEFANYDNLPTAWHWAQTGGHLRVTDRPYLLTYDYQITIDTSKTVLEGHPYPFTSNGDPSHVTIDVTGGSSIENWQHSAVGAGFASLNQSGQGSAIILPGQAVIYDFEMRYFQRSGYIEQDINGNPNISIGGDWDGAHSYSFNLNLTPVTSYGWEGISGGAFGDATNWEYDFLPGPTDIAVFGGAAALADADQVQPAGVTPGSGVLFLQAHENKAAQIKTGAFTFELGGNTYQLNESQTALAIGLLAGDSSLTLSNGTIESAGDVVVGAGPGASATLSLETNATLRINKALGALRVGTNSGGIQSASSSFTIEPGSKVIADLLLVNKDGYADFTDDQDPVQELAIGSDVLTEYPNAVGQFTDSVSIHEGGTVYANRLYLSMDGGLTVDGAGADLDVNGGQGGLIELDRFGTASMVVSNGATVTATVIQGNGNLTIESGATLNAFQQRFGNEAVIGGTGNATVIVQGAGSTLKNRDSTGEANGNGIEIGTNADGTLIVRDGGQLDGGGILLGSQSTGNGTALFEGAGTRAGVLIAVVLAKGDNSTANMTVRDNAVVEAFETRLSQGAGSSSVVEVQTGGHLAVNQLDMSNPDSAEVTVYGNLYLPEFEEFPVGWSGIALGDNDAPDAGTPTSRLRVSGVGARITSHSEDLASEPYWNQPTFSVLNIGTNGQLILENLADLRVETAVVGNVAGDEGGGHLQIDHATAEFYDDANDPETGDIAFTLIKDGGQPFRVGRGGRVDAQNQAVVDSMDVFVSSGVLNITGDLSRWTGTNVLVQGGLSSPGVFELGRIEVKDTAELILNTLDVINSGEVVVSQGGVLSTSLPSYLGGGEFDNLLAPRDVGYRRDAIVTLDATTGAATWQAHHIQIGGPGEDPSKGGVGGAIIMKGGATLTADSIVIKSDGTLIGSGTVTTTSPIIVETGGRLSVTKTQIVTPPPTAVASDGDGGAGPTLSVVGDLIVEPGAVLDFEIGGAGLGQAGGLSVAGDLLLNGMVTFTFVDGFAPSMGQSYDLLQVLGVSTIDPGLVTQIVNLQPGFDYQIDLLGGVLTMTALNDGSYMNALDGDLDGDGFVGITDLNIVLSAWNQSVTTGELLLGDPSVDGFVGIEDLNTVLGNWNAGTPPIDGANVPEPGAGVLLGLSVAATLRSRRLIG